MKPLSIPFMGGLAVLSSMAAEASSLMLDFGNPPTNAAVAAPYLTRSPGHEAGGVPLTETSWNIITTSSDRSDLVDSRGFSATGVVLELGQESSATSSTIDFGTAIGSLNLAGTGGGAEGQRSLLTAGSVYGNDTSSTAVGRDGFFGAGGATTTGTGIGMKLTGLSAGDYLLYVMARNTNSNVASLAMNVFVSTGPDAGTFHYSGVTPLTQSNIGYASAGYAGQYSTFQEGNQYVAIPVTVAEGETVFLAVDGASPGTERRGFLNAVQVVPVPEPGSWSLALMLGLAGLIRRRR